MIGSLLHLTASRPDIVFATSLCARYQEDPKVSQPNAIKQIFKYEDTSKGVKHCVFGTHQERTSVCKPLQTQTMWDAC